MPESNFTIRRSTQDEGEAVVDLWDRMCQEVPDGGPLRPCGRRNLRRLLEVAAFHRETFCLVAVAPSGEITGFGVGHLDAGDGLLPAVVGEAAELYAPDDGVRRALASAVSERLTAMGAWVVRATVAADDPAGRDLWSGLGFEADQVVLSRYVEGPCPGCGAGPDGRCSDHEQR